VSRGDTITFDLDFAAYQPLTLTPEEEILHESSKTDYAPPPERWEGSITGFETEDSINPPPEDAILFVGSSSIVGWNTSKWFPDLITINRGFGGSLYTDLVYFADRIIIPYEPATIVLYSGDNDIAFGKLPEMILADLKVLLIEIRQALPQTQTRIIVLSIKPSFARWAKWPTMQETNDLISNLCETQQNIYFADVAEVMFDETGELRDDIFVGDGLHMNETGYELWTPVVRALIDLPEPCP
jgi:lysophospholipase L1-like esterase